MARIRTPLACLLALGAATACRSGGKVDQSGPAAQDTATDVAGQDDGADGDDGDDGDDGPGDGTDGDDGLGDAEDGGGDGTDGGGYGGDGTDGAGDGTDGGGDGGDGTDGAGDGSDGTGGSDGTDGTDGTSTVSETCNGLDDDGDGLIDEDEVCGTEVYTDPTTGHAYLPMAGGYTYPQAVAACASTGYQLVGISDSTENDLVWDLIYDGTDGVSTLDEHTWIGYHDDQSGSGFVWEDGTAVGFEAWSGDVTTESWGTANFGQAGAFGDDTAAEWHEVPGSWTYAAMCESSGGS